MIDSKLAAALVKARAAITNPSRDKQGMFKDHHYAALANILDEVQPHLQDAGVILMQDIQSVGGGIRAVNMFIHESGAVLRTKGPLILLTDKKPGTAGAAATYAKRYALLAALGIEADADQDVKDLQGKTPAQPPIKDIEGVDESGMDELAVKRMYSEQINRLNAAAKNKDVDMFCTEWTRIPEADRIGVHAACLSHVRTFLKKPEVLELNREIEDAFGETALTQEDLI